MPTAPRAVPPVSKDPGSQDPGQEALTPVPLPLAAADPDAFAGALGASFEHTGFAIVSDHGLDPALLERAHGRIKAFFALPDAVKRRYHIKGGGGQRGYTPFGVEAAKGASVVDLKEFWHVARDLPPGHPHAARMAPNVWPEEVPGFREDLQALYAAFDALGARILSAIARHLKQPDDFFAASVKDGNSILRLLHYPPVPPNPEGLRAEAHEDINTITLLLGAEEAGLQLKTRDGRWLDINPPPDAVVVNIGDMLARLTNDVLPSTTHRVVNPSADRAHLPRYSIPFFLHFAPDFVIETMDSCITPARPNRYPEPITAQGFLEQRLREIRLA
ncbi:MAG: 2-oxoglutarate and iron-dependent oxygenase domain-containing protein [Hyphomonadaceae bacterium]|nr:2-oxoglutarate and iron-dependent oxygenase domain-containing protein [Hyphomonadaceae bacterium]